MTDLPKVMIVSRGVWDDSGTSSTLSNIFRNYDSEKLSQIYIETKKPNTKLCRKFFQISEFSLIKKLYRWGTKTGNQVNAEYKVDTDTARKEARTMEYVRSHRSFIYNVLRELLWHLDGWKTKELRSFIRDVGPDVVWLTGSPLILMNRLSQYVVRQSRKPFCIYEMDDVYSYRNCGSNPFKYVYRYFLRKRVKSLMEGASQVFVISKKMKREFDQLFGIDSIVLTKGIDFSDRQFVITTPTIPINMVYAGQLIYGRLSTVERIGEALDQINNRERKIVLNIYTGTSVADDIKARMTRNGSVLFHAPVSYAEIERVIHSSDVVLFVETFEEKMINLARLSFSTKLTDYLSGGKCIFAIGPNDIAPMEYLIEMDAAITVTNLYEIKDKIDYLLSTGVIEEYSRKAYECGKRNHDKSTIDRIVFGRINEIADYK